MSCERANSWMRNASVFQIKPSRTTLELTIPPVQSSRDRQEAILPQPCGTLRCSLAPTSPGPHLLALRVGVLEVRLVLLLANVRLLERDLLLADKRAQLRHAAEEVLLARGRGAGDAVQLRKGAARRSYRKRAKRLPQLRDRGCVTMDSSVGACSRHTHSSGLKASAATWLAIKT